MQEHITYLYSDMDGTLLDSQKNISPENKNAILQFTRQGGHFAVATGRSPEIALPFLKEIPITAPSIFYNGAGIYDMAAKKFLYKKFLPGNVLEHILRISIQEYPQVCIEAFAEGPIQLLNHDCIIDHYITGENQPYIFSHYNPKESYMKFLLYAEPLALKKLSEKLAPVIKGHVAFTFSSPFYLEILPLSASKGAALKWICQNYHIDPRSVGAIGDFDNDSEMLRFAGLGAAPRNGSPLALNAADHIVSSNDEHCIWDILTKYVFYVPKSLRQPEIVTSRTEASN